MAAGLPVVTHPSLGSQDNAQTELVEHGVTGFVVNSPDEYAQAVAFLLSNPEKSRFSLAPPLAKRHSNAIALTAWPQGLHSYTSISTKERQNLASHPAAAIER